MKFPPKFAVAFVAKTVSSTVSVGSAVALIAIDGPSSSKLRVVPMFKVAAWLSLSPSMILPVRVIRSAVSSERESSWLPVSVCTTARS